ncbi:MAG: dephospho-CoA kinase [Firmicutes bacterium]|nr:dephospho-CoA kinase [Bacillota bacterium]MBV1726943.1 dephospho-CoA kinase [Desulforudis sp.]MBU4533987.1 dephospho-CoA kinase [Bacillota bacterium]MBU4554215.1 dephospho-CoA kinase [Bacillota bacterium]MBV1734805.1 dephospho-CoA kinase [Desulforudis sp.]
MVVIGLTGDAGSGKSTVAAILEELGARVISADAVAKMQTEPGSPIFDEIIRTFGSAYLTAAGQLDRRRLGELVFGDPQARERLNAITHPPVFDAIAEEIEKACRDGEKVVVVEVPLLFETGSGAMFDEVWVVTAGQATKMRRLMERGLTEETAGGVLASQLPQAEKVGRANRVLDNEGSLDDTRRQVEQFWSMLHPV